MGERERHRAQGRENKGAKEKGESTYQFGVDFGVQSSVADKVDDPSLGLLGGHVQLVCQHTERHTQTHTHTKSQLPLDLQGVRGVYVALSDGKMNWSSHHSS